MATRPPPPGDRHTHDEDDDEKGSVVDDGLLCVLECGCIRTVDDELIEACETCWPMLEMEDERCRELVGFHSIVFGSLMCDIDAFPSMATLIADAAEGGDLQDAVAPTLKTMLRILAEEFVPTPWFMWLVEQADQRDDVRMLWPPLLDGARRRNDYWELLRPHGLNLVNNVDADLESFIAAVVTAQIRDEGAS